MKKKTNQGDVRAVTHTGRGGDREKAILGRRIWEGLCEEVIFQLRLQ